MLRPRRGRGFGLRFAQVWGFTDRHTWIGTASAPLLFDAEYNPKPAAFALINELLNTTATRV